MGKKYQVVVFDDFDDREGQFVPDSGDDWTTRDHLKPRFSYEFLNVHIVSEYCVCQACNPLSVYHKYFEKVYEYAGRSLYEIMGDKNFKLNYEPKGTELRIYLKLRNLNSISPEERPVIGHFPLWTSKDSSPRVFFFVGKDAIFHIMYIDYHHSTHSTEHRPSR